LAPSKVTTLNRTLIRLAVIAQRSCVPDQLRQTHHARYGIIRRNRPHYARCSFDAGLDDAELSTRTMLTAIVNLPTRGTNVLDKIYVNDTSYDAVKVVTPTMRSDHKAVIAYTGAPPRQLNKTRERRVFRRRSPSQHALFLQHASAVTFDFHDGASVQSDFDVMYTIMRELLDRFYPERQVTVTAADPRCITPAVKAMLRRKIG